MSEEHVYRVSSSWTPAEKQGFLTSGSGTLSTPFGGAPSLGGRADRMPYGGVKDSGVGREGPLYAMEEFTEPRLLVLRAP